MNDGRTAVTVVVVAHDMARELPRTVRSLTPPYQRAVPGGHEIVIVDNGSRDPVAPPRSGCEVPVTVHRLDPASPSPAHAANVGIGSARGDVVGLIVDGARMASPRLLATAALAARLDERAVVTAPAWHLGRDVHARADATGHTIEAEDQLLADSGWENDGDALFGIATPAVSSARGLFGPMGESSSLFMRRALWDEIGGLDERFALPGGGMVNHDLYRRACELTGAQLVVLLGEGTFHQMHGGAATSGRITRDEMRADYARIVGREHKPPSNAPLYLGTVPRQYVPYVEQSARRVTSAPSRDDDRR